MKQSKLEDLGENKNKRKTWHSTKPYKFNTEPKKRNRIRKRNRNKIIEIRSLSCFPFPHFSPTKKTQVFLFLVKKIPNLQYRKSPIDKIKPS